MNELKNGFAETFKRLKKDKRAFVTVAAGIIGMVLVLFSELPFFEAEKSSKDVHSESLFYSELEASTQKLISQIEGAGKVSVMLTYESTEERIWAKDKEQTENADGKNETTEKHIIVDADGGETGLEIKVIYPKVRGVAVVCSGGDDPLVKSEIKALLSALFDIGSNRISIARRAE